MNEMETVIFGMISQVGSARSSYLEGLRAAREGNFEEAEAKTKRRRRNTRKRAPRAS
ncbi:hypothetical protein LM7416_240065 [Listeria monocytogenes]|nr:hypothetical protein LM7414_250065 [Listeria monocytogenes]CUL27940.1 hypothetical protein LM7416_240065 [Listeria monocytogenes]